MDGDFMMMNGSMHGGIQKNISETLSAADAARAKSKAESNTERLRRLEENLAKSFMICEVLWEMLRDEHGYTEEQLREKIYEVDMRDGVLNGKNQPKASKCPECSHMVSPRHPACTYCGRVIERSIFTME